MEKRILGNKVQSGGGGGMKRKLRSERSFAQKRGERGTFPSYYKNQDQLSISCKLQLFGIYILCVQEELKA